MSIPGIAHQASAAIISEIGVDVSAYFTTAEHLAPWAGLCPGKSRINREAVSRDPP